MRPTPKIPVKSHHDDGNGPESWLLYSANHLNHINPSSCVVRLPVKRLLNKLKIPSDCIPLKLGSTPPIELLGAHSAVSPVSVLIVEGILPDKLFHGKKTPDELVLLNQQLLVGFSLPARNNPDTLPD